MRLSDGPLADAVLAAAAIPGVLPPVRWRGRLLADGGIAGNTPIWHAVALGARRIYVSADLELLFADYLTHLAAGPPRRR